MFDWFANCLSICRIDHGKIQIIQLSNNLHEGNTN